MVSRSRWLWISRDAVALDVVPERGDELDVAPGGRDGAGRRLERAGVRAPPGDPLDDGAAARAVGSWLMPHLPSRPDRPWVACPLPRTLSGPRCAEKRQMSRHGRGACPGVRGVSRGTDGPCDGRTTASPPFRSFVLDDAGPAERERSPAAPSVSPPPVGAVSPDGTRAVPGPRAGNPRQARVSCSASVRGASDAGEDSEAASPRSARPGRHPVAHLGEQPGPRVGALP